MTQNYLKIKLTFIAIGLALLFPMLSEAQTQASFTWDTNIEPDIAGYRVFHRLEGTAYNYKNPAWQGSKTSCTIDIANEDVRHYFVARAFDTQGFESQNSDEVCLGCDTETSDTCPNDPNKTAPGICGCGIPDIDTDGDGTLDCNDSCPNDPAKVVRGVCGCGTPDIDTDRDGTLDCNDSCPNDPNKTSPGANGCGFPEDSDNCPNDPNKEEPGICGCGVADIDTDGDHVWDCNDADDDNDGIADIAEAKVPNQGDANQDGIPDSLQCNVGSIKTSDTKKYISIESSDGTCISNFKRVDTLAPEEFPEDIVFFYGLYEYSVQDTGYGKSVIVTMILPQGASPDTFYIYGQTSDNPMDHWYEFLDNGQTGAEIDENRITLYLTDGKRGDNDLTKNRTIISLGGPGYISDGTERDFNPGGESTSSSAGSGCFIDCFTQ